MIQTTLYTTNVKYEVIPVYIILHPIITGWWYNATKALSSSWITSVTAHGVPDAQLWLLKNRNVPKFSWFHTYLVKSTAQCVGYHRTNRVLSSGRPKAPMPLSFLLTPYVCISVCLIKPIRPVIMQGAVIDFPTLIFDNSRHSTWIILKQ